MAEYRVIGVKELLSKPDLTPDEMAAYRVKIDHEGEDAYTKFMEYEIQIEFMLRAAGYVPGKEKEKKRRKMLIQEGHKEMLEFWYKAMQEVDRI